MQNRFAEMEKRMVRNYLTGGIGMIAASPVVFLLAPFGLFLGTGVLVIGIITVVRAATMSSKSKQPPAP
jgi:hypothetical protein